MSLLERPQRVADEIEWILFTERATEVSRGDVAVELGFEVPEDRAPDIDLQPNSAVDRGIDDCFDHLFYRASAFAENYAFTVSRDVVRRSATVETDQSVVYRFLLACSRPSLSQSLAATFSELCKLSLQRFLGPCARVWNVDAGSTDRQLIGTSTESVARYLAPFLAAKVDEDQITNLPSTGGDGGVDIVATFSFSDAAHGSMALLGQCAASSDAMYWRDKIYQPLRFQHLFKWTSEPVLVCFIPYVYRGTNGAWLNPLNVVGTLLFDRFRLLHALDLGKQPLSSSFKRELVRAIAAAEDKAKQRKKPKAPVRRVAAKKFAPKKAAAKTTAAKKIAPKKAASKNSAKKSNPERRARTATKVAAQKASPSKTATTKRRAAPERRQKR